MKSNIGPIERWMRIVLGTVITSLTIIGPQSGWALLGMVPLLSGFLAFCPFYAVLGRNHDLSLAG